MLVSCCVLSGIGGTYRFLREHESPGQQDPAAIKVQTAHSERAGHLGGWSVALELRMSMSDDKGLPHKNLSLQDVSLVYEKVQIL